MISEARRVCPSFPSLSNQRLQRPGLRHHGEVPQDQQGGRALAGPLRRSQGRHRQELRRWHQGAPLRPCYRLRHRQVSPQGDQEGVTEDHCQALKAESLYESSQLQPHDAHQVYFGCRFEVHCDCRKAGVYRKPCGSQKGGESRFGREVQDWQEQVVLLQA